MLMVFGLAYVVTRYLSGRSGSGQSRGQIKILERVGVGKDRQILLVQLGSEYFLAGVTGQSIQFSPPVHPEDFATQLEKASQPGSLLTQLLARRKDQSRANDQSAN
jgi:flagellar biogenesis protein FliO